VSETFSRPPPESHGCDVCRRMAWLYFEPPVVEIGHLGGGHLLYRCETCGALWEQALRFNAPIAEAEARMLCPSAFDTK
jgi:hypothetical protein